MRKIANISNNDKRALFRNTASKKGLSDAIIEKDFWVCYMLDYLFHKNKWADKIIFKGGTSLSKGFNLINRFSEDIDLILDWEVLGYTENEFWADRSNSAQEKFNAKLEIETIKFLTEEFLPTLKSDLTRDVNFTFELEFDEEDKQTIKFIYSNLFQDKAILQEIRLEIGTLAAHTPVEIVKIYPYVAEEYGKLFEVPYTEVLTVKPERTFWEKATILHREANRKNGQLPKRYSRHYYDLYRMANSSVKGKALDDRVLLNQVVEFKDKFYHCTWADYGACLKGCLKLVPKNDEIIEKLKIDYLHMRSILFGIVPTFEEIIICLQQLEDEINKKLK
jgi:hypothetical protein